MMILYKWIRALMIRHEISLDIKYNAILLLENIKILTLSLVSILIRLETQMIRQ